MKSNNQNKRIHGIISLLIAGAAILTGFLAVCSADLYMALAYLMVIIASPFAVTYFFCSKCPCRFGKCAHVLPAKLTKIYKSRKNTKYEFIDYFVTVSALLLLFGIPQFWLIKNTWLMMIFWVLSIVAFAEIRSFICVKCGNQLCPAKKLINPPN